MCNTHPVYIQLTTYNYSLSTRMVRNGPFLEICENDNIIPMSLAYAIGRWASTDECKFLYLAGPIGSGADAVMRSLMRSLNGAPDVIFTINYPWLEYKDKQVIRVIDNNIEVYAPSLESSVVQFENEYDGFDASKEELGAFLLAIGDHKGPSNFFKCSSLNGIVCHNGVEKCAVCSSPLWELCPFMVDIDLAIEDESEDEGICV
uniref:ORF52 n=1 Tax=Pacific black duck aviadenovirus TaxID=2798287 RepID=A0A7T4S078_9ADEN|nr:ORF52 [Pacific black duck aviadenovirus]